MAGQSVCLSHQSRKPAPACRGRLGDVLLHIDPVIGHARHALDLTGGQAQHLAQLADRSPRTKRRKGRHQRGALMSVALVHTRDQDLADVAREVEVDVGQPVQVLVQEAPQQ